MKQFFMMGLLLAAVIVGSVAQADTPASKEVTVNINGAYVPGGFDSTSDVFVVENGIFPNGCYKWSRADVTHPSQFTHEVRSVATVSQGMCLMVLVPFTKEVHVGQIGAGDHKIHFMNGDGTYLEKEIKIEE